MNRSNPVRPGPYSRRVHLLDRSEAFDGHPFVIIGRSNRSQRAASCLDRSSQPVQCRRRPRTRTPSISSLSRSSPKPSSRREIAVVPHGRVIAQHSNVLDGHRSKAALRAARSARCSPAQPARAPLGRAYADPIARGADEHVVDRRLSSGRTAGRQLLAIHASSYHDSPFSTLPESAEGARNNRKTSHRPAGIATAVPRAAPWRRLPPAPRARRCCRRAGRSADRRWRRTLCRAARTTR